MAARLARWSATVALVSGLLAATALGAAHGADTDPGGDSDGEVTHLPLVVNGEAITIGGVTPYGNYGHYIDVLGNDRDPDGGVLDLCGFTNPHEDKVTVTGTLRFPHRRGMLSLDPVVNETATYEVTYVACNDTYRGEGTLTVHVYRIDPVEARTVAPGRIEFTNPGTRRVNVTYGRNPAERYDARFRLAGGASQVVRVHRSTISWYADRNAYPAGEGRITDTGAPDHAAVPRLRAKVVAPHTVRFTNAGEFRVELSYGVVAPYKGYGYRGPDDVVTLAPGESLTVKTRRDAMRYRCTVSYGLPLGHGVLTRIRNPR